MEKKMKKHLIGLLIIALLIAQTGCMPVHIWETARGGKDLTDYDNKEISYADSSLLFAIGTPSDLSTK